MISMRRALPKLSIALLLAALAGCSQPRPAAEPPAVVNQPPAGESPVTATSDRPAAAPKPCAEPRDTAVFAGDPGTSPPPGPAGTPEKPGIELADVSLNETHEHGGRALGRKLLTGGSGTVVVGVDEFVFQLRLYPAPASLQWFHDNVVVQGATPAPFAPELARQGSLALVVPKGRPGDVVTVAVGRLTTADGGGELKLTFCRVEEPRASLEVKTAAGWAPASPEQRVAGNPLVVRLSFSQPMDRASVEAQLSRITKSGAAPPFMPPPARLQWESDTSLLLTYDDPGPRVVVDVAGARSQHGLWIVGKLPAVYVGSAPYLAAIAPGEPEERLVDLPPDIFAASPSAAGDRVLVHAYRWFTQDGAETSASLVHVPTGRRTPVEIGYGSWFWLQDDQGIALEPYGRWAWKRYSAAGERVDGGSLPAFVHGAPSPEGDRVAILSEAAGPISDEPPYLRSHDLRVLDWTGRVLHATPKFIRVWFPPKDGLPALNGPVWSPDASRLAALSDGPDGATELVTVELSSGRLARVALNPAEIRNGNRFLPLSWSPDGQRLTAGGLLIDPATGVVLKRLAKTPFIRPLWSRDGDSLLWHHEPWGEVIAYRLSTGRAESLGDGFAVGWDASGRALVIRWADAAARFVPYGL